MRWFPLLLIDFRSSLRMHINPFCVLLFVFAVFFILKVQSVFKLDFGLKLCLKENGRTRWSHNYCISACEG